MPATRAKTLRMLATSETYIINHDGQRIGTFALYDFRQGKADFGRFMVIPGEQGNGVGDWAMQKAIKWAVARGLRRLELLVREDNAVAVDLYTRHGFFPVRRGPGYSVMRKSL
jgi:GNAT superfamily N-acetyltransferase